MSKLIKQLVTDELKARLRDVGDLLLVDVVGLDANRTTALRKTLREKNIHLLVVKNSLARRATEGTALAPAFEGSSGSLAIVWGGADVVTLAKEVTRIAGDKDYAPFQARGGVMDGTALSAQQVRQVSKWPTRDEQLGLLLGQILSPGARLASQLLAAGGALASQIKQQADKEGEAAPEAGAASQGA